MKLMFGEEGPQLEKESHSGPLNLQVLCPRDDSPVPAFHGSFASTRPPAVGRLFDRHGTTVVTGRGCLGAGRSPDEWGDDRVLRERSGDA